MPIPLIGFIGQSAVLGRERDEERSDFRRAPASDRGDAYGDRGQLGVYSPSEEPFPTPDGVKCFSGFGATEADLERGWCEPGIRENPAYDKSNYASRSTLPKVADEDQGNADWMRDDLEFRGRNNRSRGFLTRPRIPTERG